MNEQENNLKKHSRPNTSKRKLESIPKELIMEGESEKKKVRIERQLEKTSEPRIQEQPKQCFIPNELMNLLNSSTKPNINLVTSKPFRSKPQIRPSSSKKSRERKMGDGSHEDEYFAYACKAKLEIEESEKRMKEIENKMKVQENKKEELLKHIDEMDNLSDVYDSKDKENIQRNVDAEISNIRFDQMFGGGERESDEEEEKWVIQPTGEMEVIQGTADHIKQIEGIDHVADVPVLETILDVGEAQRLRTEVLDDIHSRIESRQKINESVNKDLDIYLKEMESIRDEKGELLFKKRDNVDEMIEIAKYYRREGLENKAGEKDSDFWLRYLTSPEKVNTKGTPEEIAKQLKMMREMEKVRQLDIILAKRTKTYRESKGGRNRRKLDAAEYLEGDLLSKSFTERTDPNTFLTEIKKKRENQSESRSSALVAAPPEAKSQQDFYKPNLSLSGWHKKGKLRGRGKGRPDSNMSGISASSNSSSKATPASERKERNKGVLYKISQKSTGPNFVKQNKNTAFNRGAEVQKLEKKKEKMGRLLGYADEARKGESDIYTETSTTTRDGDMGDMGNVTPKSPTYSEYSMKISQTLNDISVIESHDKAKLAEIDKLLINYAPLEQRDSSTGRIIVQRNLKDGCTDLDEFNLDESFLGAGRSERSYMSISGTSVTSMLTQKAIPREKYLQQQRERRIYQTKIRNINQKLKELDNEEQDEANMELINPEDRLRLLDEFREESARLMLLPPTSHSRRNLAIEYYKEAQQLANEYKPTLKDEDINEAKNELNEMSNKFSELADELKMIENEKSGILEPIKQIKAQLEEEEKNLEKDLEILDSHEKRIEEMIEKDKELEILESEIYKASPPLAIEFNMDIGITGDTEEDMKKLEEEIEKKMLRENPAFLEISLRELEEKITLERVNKCINMGIRDSNNMAKSVEDKGVGEEKKEYEIDNYETDNQEITPIIENSQNNENYENIESVINKEELSVEKIMETNSSGIVIT